MSYEKVLMARGKVTAKETATLARMHAHKAKLEKLPPGPVTPIVFSLTENKPLADLLSEKGGRF